MDGLDEWHEWISIHKYPENSFQAGCSPKDLLAVLSHHMVKVWLLIFEMLEYEYRVGIFGLKSSGSGTKSYLETMFIFAHQETYMWVLLTLKVSLFLHHAI